MDYNFREIEKKWQQYWEQNDTYKVTEDLSRPKYYVLDMFPYPSGAGLHVGHPLGYIASDIVSRYKRLRGFNVLHPMGYDAFGLPAEQYAIQTGQHPAVTTENNIKRYREQLTKIGFCYDWSREVRTCDPKYYKWTQWAFIQMFHHWYNNKSDKAEPIATLIAEFEKNGNTATDAAHNCEVIFTADEWKGFDEKRKMEILLCYRLAYLADTMVNWCPALGTVLANDEVREGFSVRGGHPVVQRKMQQWLLRVSAYAKRLLDGLDNISWSESIRDVQKNWIGRSEGCEIDFPVESSEEKIRIFTTRPDTIYGAMFIVLAPEYEGLEKLTTPAQKKEVDGYIEQASKRTERERMADTGKVTGCFTGSYAINPFTNEKMPIWVSDYVLAGYGTGAIMCVPAHDGRDFIFQRYFKLPTRQVIQKPGEEPSDPNTWAEVFESKDGICINSPLINGLTVKEAITKMIAEVGKMGIGVGKVNYRLRDAIFSRQRYWGEPFPVYYKDGLPYTIDESMLPLELPEIDAYKPTEDGQPPLGRAKNWKTSEGHPYELSTMPGFAGSSAYYIRYMDPHNDNALAAKEKVGYWRNVDLYIGGIEHATGHLIYARFWNKFLYDIGVVCEDEPFKKLVNQGMILGVSEKIYIEGKTESGNAFSNTFNLYDINKGVVKNSVSLEKPVSIIYSSDIYDKYIKNSETKKCMSINVDISYTNKSVLNIVDFINDQKYEEYQDAVFITNDGGFWQKGKYFNQNLIQEEKESYHFFTHSEVEKMSKSKYNVVNPDDVIEKYGADTLRMYEMFLGPLEQSKPWDTNGIEGVHKFLRKTWRLFAGRDGENLINDSEPDEKELKVLHKLIKKVQEDIEGFSFNTSVSAFMIAVNELGSMDCHKRKILEPLLICLSPFAPHLSEELWQFCGHTDSITSAAFPEFNEKYLTENSFEYPVSFNGKMRFKLNLPLDMSEEEMTKSVTGCDEAQKWLEGKNPKKVIIVRGKIINIVV